MQATLSRPDPADPTLAARWEAMAEAVGAAAFLRWPWLATHRWRDSRLVEVHHGNELRGLAWLGRRPGPLGPSLALHETTDPAQDSVFIEHNGVLASPQDRAAVLACVLRAAAGRFGRVALSGIDGAGLEAARAAGGVLGPVQTRAAPYATLLPGGPWIERLSANTRAQARRSARAYEAHGPITLERADTPAVAKEWLEALLALHVATWSARGVSSGFATAPVQRFHHAIIGRGVPTGLVDVLRIQAGARPIGYLLNLHAAGCTLAYQSGFHYEPPGSENSPHKPGLTCHLAALEHARARGDREYDLLAGDARYKRSLANASRDLHWTSWQPRTSAYAVAASIKSSLAPP